MDQQTTPLTAMPSASPPPQAPAAQTYSPSPQAAYPVQGTAAMAPQYQAAPQMGQVLQFPSPQAAQPQGLTSDPALSVIQQQQQLLDRVVSYLHPPQTAQIPYQSPAVQSPAPQYQSYPQQTGFQQSVSPVSPPIYNTTPASSNNYSPASSAILGMLQTQEGLRAAATLSESELAAAGISRSAVTALATDLETRLGDAMMALRNAAAVAHDAIAMKALFEDPGMAHDLSICTIDSLLRNNGMDTFLEYFEPVITSMNQAYAMQNQPQNQQPAPAYAGPVEQVANMTAPQRFDPLAAARMSADQRMQQNSALQNDGRTAFPPIPQQSGGSGNPSLDQVPPHLRWKALDAGLIG